MNKSFRYYKSLFRIILMYLNDKVLWRKKAAILMYHSIANSPEYFAVALTEFEDQMKYLSQKKYNVISLSELVDYLIEGKKLSRNSVVVTFDDGYEDNYLAAFPVLKKYNFPATIFLTTGLVGDKGYVNKRGVKMPMLDWDQIKEMHGSGLIDFQPHTSSHPRLSQISIEEASREIESSKSEIEYRLGRPCHFFCYPYGDYNEEVVSVAKESFLASLTVRAGWVDDSSNPLLLKRNSVDSLTTPFIFKLKV